MAPRTWQHQKHRIQQRDVCVMAAARDVHNNPSKADLRRMLAQAAANTDPRPPLTSACITTTGPTVSDGNEQGAGADTHHQEQTP
jgi:hypothetical protein